MKNTALRRRWLGAVIVLLMTTVLSGCGDDFVWSPTGPTGWNFEDSRLSGYWQLAQVNGYPVRGYDTNYLDFYGDGWGRYYYYRNSTPRSQRIAYWCQQSNNAYSYYQINIQYEDGQASTMNYWFSDGGRTLYMRWNSSAGIQTYAYVRVSNIGPGW